MSMLDSEPVFDIRMTSTGSSVATLDKFKAQGITTLAKLAYCSASQPGQDETAFQQVICRVMGVESITGIDVGTLSSIRRCWWESHTVAVSEIRQTVERTDTSEPTKMPMPEREARFRSLQVKLVGVNLTPQLEPSFQLVDFCNSLRASEELKYICPSKCTSREQEIRGIRKDPTLKSMADGSIRLVQQETSLVADLSSEYRVRLALQRRALALEMVHLATYSVIETYHDYLYQMMLREVPDSHDKLGIQQILKADNMVFVKIIELCRGGISQRPDGKYPIEEALSKVQLDPVVLASLQPLPKSSNFSRRPQDSNPASVPYSSQGNGSGKGKGKGKNKGKSKVFSVPKELEGLNTRTKNGNPICFAANLPEGCAGAKWGQRCTKGLHVCMRCGGPHASTKNECRGKQ